MYRVVKTCYLDMAHRVRGHKGKCQNVHGHTYMVELSLSSPKLAELGMVVDFHEFSEFFRTHVLPFDHSLLTCKEDFDKVLELCEYHPTGANLTMRKLREAWAIPEFGGDASSWKKLPFNPTAENLAAWFFASASHYFRNRYGVQVDYVRVYEQLHPVVAYAEFRPAPKGVES